MAAVELRTKVGSTIKVLSAWWNFGFKVWQPYFLGTVIACSYIPLAWVAYKNTFAPGHTDFSDAMIAAMYLIILVGVFFTSGLKTLVPLAIYMFAGMDAASFMLFASAEQRAATVFPLAFVIAFFQLFEHALKYALSKSYRKHADLERMLRKLRRPYRTALKRYFKTFHPHVRRPVRRVFATQSHFVFRVRVSTPDVVIDRTQLSSWMISDLTIEELKQSRGRIINIMIPHGVNAGEILEADEVLDLS